MRVSKTMLIKKLFMTLGLVVCGLACDVPVHAQGNRLNNNAVQQGSALPKNLAQRYKSTPLADKIVRYDAGDGQGSHVKIQWKKGVAASDATTRKITALTNPMCLTKEEVRGQKIESEIVLPQGSSVLQIVPGGVFDSQELLRSGQFKYVKWDKRMTYAINASSNLVKKTSATITASKDGISESAAHSVVKSLTKPNNFTGMPNSSSNSELKRSTFQESLGLSIGASFFYMGISGEDQFSFSSEKYRYMYVYTFDQNFLAVSADGPSKPEDLFTDVAGLSPDALFLREVKYGRRLYVIMESEYDLEKYSNELKGSLEWGAVSAKLQQKNTGSKASEYINVRIQTQGGQAIALPDFTKLQATLDNYFQSSYGENDIVPLAYKVTDLSGTPVSLTANAFLDGNHCLEATKARVRLTQIEVKKADDGGDNEQIYGGVSIRLFNGNGKQVAVDGTTEMPKVGNVTPPSGYITVAKEEAPLILKQGLPKTFGINEQGKYIDVNLNNLDMTFQVEPIIKEQDDFEDDEFVTDNKLKKKLRQMLIEGQTTTTFEFRHDKSVLQLTIEIEPL